MRQCQLALYVFANGLILFAIWPNGLSAVGWYEAGSSFSPLQERSFWTSDGGNYTFGFQAVNGGKDYLLSIWLSKDPQKMAIWWPHVASNDGDSSVKQGASFEFTSKGSTGLELYMSPSLLWSSNITGANYAKLYDTGNLMLFESKESAAAPLWQSFEHNQDSLMLLVGSDNINVNTKATLLQSRMNQSSYVRGRFNLQIDTENLELHGKDFLGTDSKYADGKMSTRGGFLQIGKDKNTYNSSSSNGVRRLTLGYDGNLRIHEWEASNTSWVKAWQILDNKCRLGSPCGPFGICLSVDDDGKVKCSCPTGYKPRAAHDPSQGCENSISFPVQNCNLADITMEEVPDADYYFDDLDIKLDVTKDDCKQICSKNCACMASVYSQSNETCFVKGGVHYLMNGYNSTGSSFRSVLFIKVEITSKQMNWVNIGVGVAAAVLVVVGFGTWLIWRRSRKNANPVLQLGRYKPKQGVPGDAGPVKFYRVDELVTATGNFSEALGEGGFGTVFEGWLPIESTGFHDSMHIDTDESTLGSNVDGNNQHMRAVAVKVLRDFAGKRSDVDAHNDSYSQFKAEINTLGKIHHVNLVSLLGYSYSTTGAHTENARMLVYECMEKGSLDKYLSTAHEYAQPKLTWGTRYSIALGIARGMAYLHHDCNPPILHCDIKPHNILLDDNFIAKVADFGFARRVHLHHPYGHIILSSVRGTHGYLAPEWLTSDGPTFKVDVYSFGKLLLELVRGFKAAADGLTMPVVEWAIKCMSQGVVMEFSKPLDVQADGNLIELVPLPHQEYHDSQLQEANEKLRLLKVGMWCIQHEPSSRPTMSGVVQLIEGGITMEDPPIPLTPLELLMPSGNQSSSTRTYHYSSSFSGR